MNTRSGPRKRRSRVSGRTPASARPTDGVRDCGGCDSSRNRNTAATQNSAYAASTQKIQCHEPFTRSKPPASGARIGATPMTSIMSDSTRADCRASNRSRITARITTMPAEPPSAWAKRSSAKLSMLWASAQPADASANRPSPARSGRLRPKRSVSGPKASCPSPMPNK